MKSFVSDWKLFLSDKKNAFVFFASFGWVIVLLFSFEPFFNFTEHRSGTQLHDWLLSKIPAFDLSWIIFSIMYFVVFAGFFYALRIPKLLSRALLAYAILTTMRLLSIYFIKLEHLCVWLQAELALWCCQIVIQCCQLLRHLPHLKL